jgi:UDP-N-acetylmuramate--alanine ligase
MLELAQTKNFRLLVTIDNMKTDIPFDFGIIHFVGIGGIGMSGLASILHNIGYEVQGSDLNRNDSTAKLEREGITIFTPQQQSNINSNVKLLVVSTAIKDDNPEVISAHEQGIPIIHRSKMLAELTRLKKTVAVSGTHGKTTITTMLANLWEQATLEPTVINGGIINTYNSNTNVGNGEWIIAEADESDKTFLQLRPNITIVNNINPEHLEHYDNDYSVLKQAFINFINNTPFYGCALLCLDNEGVRSILPHIQGTKYLTYGLSKDNNISAKNIIAKDKGMYFDVMLSKKTIAKNVFLPMVGKHNVQNALSLYAVATHLGFDYNIVTASLANFRGVKRRFTVTGNFQGAVCVDDYAHHPTEIISVLNAARDYIGRGGKVICVIQPHRYSRLYNLWEEFIQCSKYADYLYITTVYEAGEKPIDGINAINLASQMREFNNNVDTVKDVNDLRQKVSAYVSGDDIIVFMGAGCITRWSYALS